MIAILKSEWIKYRTLMSNWVLAIIAFAFPVVVVVLVAALGDLFEINGGDLAELILCSEYRLGLIAPCANVT